MVEILISSSVLILVLAIVRLALKDKISARLQYALWLLVAVRLLVPVSFFHSPVSVAFAAAPMVEQAARLSDTVVSPGGDAAAAETAIPPEVPQAASLPDMTAAVTESAVSSAPAATETAPARQTVPVRTLRDAARLVWYIGMAAMAAWLLFVNVRMSLHLAKARRPYAAQLTPPVYTASGIPSPCLFGVFRPTIYLTEQAASDPAQARQICVHEQTHFRHGDMLWALLRSVCLVIWWFNPLVWLAAALSRQDCELACDEGTIKALGEDARFDYGRTLVGMAKVGTTPSDLLCGATTMTTGKKSLMERVARIAKAPKTSASVLIAVLLIAVAAVGCTFSGAPEAAPTLSPELTVEGPAELAVPTPEPTTEPEAAAASEEIEAPDAVLPEEAQSAPAQEDTAPAEAAEEVEAEEIAAAEDSTQTEETVPAEYVTTRFEGAALSAYGDPQESFTVRLPQVNVDSEYAAAVNSEIWDKYYEEPLYSSGDVDYTWAQNGDILSLVIRYDTYMNDVVEWDVYNIDLTTGRQASADALLQYAGLSQASYMSRLEEALDEVFTEKYAISGLYYTEDEKSEQEASPGSDFFAQQTAFWEAQRAATVSAENLAECRPYLDASGRLCVIAKIYSIAGATYYEHSIVL